MSTSSVILRAAVLAPVMVAAGCGYRPLFSELQKELKQLKIEAISPRRVDQPVLSRLLLTELTRQLARSGLRVVTAGPAPYVLIPQLLGLFEHTPLVTARGSIAAQSMTLQLELVLRRADGSTVWRSGIIETTHTWPYSALDLWSTEMARRQALDSLAFEAAQQAIQALAEAGPGLPF